MINAVKNDQENEDSPLIVKKDSRLVEDSSSEVIQSKNRRLVEGKSKEAITPDFIESYTGERCIEKSHFQSQQDSDVTKLRDRHSGSPNEKSLLIDYLDLFKVRPSDSLAVASSQSYPCNVAMELRSSKREILLNGLKPFKSRRKNKSNDCPAGVGQGNSVIHPGRHLIVGDFAGNGNVRSSLKRPLNYHLGALDNWKISKKERSTNLRREIGSQIMSSPEVASITSSMKVKSKRNGQEKMLKRQYSPSSTNCSCSDLSSLSAFAPVSQGMLHCKWKGEIPYWMFSVIDDQGEVYLAKLHKVKSSNEKGLDYVYSFHLRTDKKKVLGTSGNSVNLLGNMRVSNSFTLCPNNLKLLETEFILFATDEPDPDEMRSSTSADKKSGWFSRKVVGAFRSKHRSMDKSRLKVVPSFSEEQCAVMLGELNSLDSILPESNLCPNLELAAVVVREYVRETCQEEAVGGWGLKFLEKVGEDKTYTPVEGFNSPESCEESSHRNRNDCSISMNVLIPAGFHGGPRTRDEGPSGLNVRWRSGGCCDCGGWDIGCPLTVLHNMSIREGFPQTDAVLLLFMQGSEKEELAFKMVHVRDGLYFIHFESSLTALQAFSIGVATLHIQTSDFCPKHVEELKQ